MCKDRALFVSLKAKNATMDTAVNPLEIQGEGIVRFATRDTSGAVRVVQLSNVNYVPKLSHNLLTTIKTVVHDGFDITI